LKIHQKSNTHFKLQKKNLSGQVAIVTGAGMGIGYEICRQLCEEGASVVLNDIDENLAEIASEKIRNQGGNCVSFSGNCSEISVIENLVKVAVETFGKLTITIANAGITTFGDFLKYEPKSLDNLLKINLFGSFFLTQSSAKQMISQQSGGRILLMSSVTGRIAHPNLAAYGMTKAALEQLAKNLVIDLSPHQITINTIAPGATLTERTIEDIDYNNTWSRITPMQKPASVEDIASAALFLVSPQAGHITGQSIAIDGGWTSVGVSPYL
jgi:glucose 1-dehydrogenase